MMHDLVARKGMDQLHQELQGRPFKAFVAPHLATQPRLYRDVGYVTHVQEYAITPDDMPVLRCCPPGQSLWGLAFSMCASLQRTRFAHELQCGM